MSMDFGNNAYIKVTRSDMAQESKGEGSMNRPGLGARLQEMGTVAKFPVAEGNQRTGVWSIEEDYLCLATL